MLFGPGVLIAGGVTIGLAFLDKSLEEFGFHRLGSLVKILLPIAAFGMAIYFLEHNAILWWLK